MTLAEIKLLLLEAAITLEKKSRRAHPCDDVHKLIERLKQAAKTEIES